MRSSHRHTPLLTLTVLARWSLSQGHHNSFTGNRLRLPLSTEKWRTAEVHTEEEHFTEHAYASKAISNLLLAVFWRKIQNSILHLHDRNISLNIAFTSREASQGTLDMRSFLVWTDCLNLGYLVVPMLQLLQGFCATMVSDLSAVSRTQRPGRIAKQWAGMENRTAALYRAVLTAEISPKLALLALHLLC